jgi:DNA-binding MarR family transcriptional regulator
MSYAIAGRNPLFLRDEELDRTLELMMLAEREVANRTAELRERLGLDDVDFQILYLVQRHQGTTMAELCAVLGLNKQSLSRHVRRLVDLGFLVQAASAGDKRKRPLAITEAGSSQLGEIGTVTKRRLRRAFMNAGPDAVEGFQRVLAELVDGPGRRWAARRSA